MSARTGLTLLLAAAIAAVVLRSTPISACCPAPPSGKPVVNADQTVILIWDAATKTQHFIRRASFRSEADDFGFLVPTPARPELEESGNEAFPYLQKLTEPERIKRTRPSEGMNCGCGCASPTKDTATKSAGANVTVLETKRVAGFNATVLQAGSADALVRWLKDHGYAFSPEVEAWAKPYVEAGWKITALKVAKDGEGEAKKSVAASALRLSFKTDRPLFPYREPDPTAAAAALGTTHRLLRIYFVADARYRGELTKAVAWTGKVAWANKINPADRGKVLDLLKLPDSSGPADWWLTEYEDDWPYQVAPADLYFARDTDQTTIKRPPIIEYVAAPWPIDATAYACAAVIVLPPLIRRVRRRSKYFPTD